MRPHPETWLKVLPAGLFCEPGGFFIDPLRPVDRAVITHGHSDHARAGHRAVLATADTLAVMQARLGDWAASRSRRWDGMSRSRWARCGCGLLRPAMCWAARRWRWSIAGLGRWSAATTNGSPIRPARGSSRCRATCSSPRRRSRCRCSCIRRRRERSGGCWTAWRCFPTGRMSWGATRWANASG